DLASADGASSGLSRRSRTGRGSAGLASPRVIGSSARAGRLSRARASVARGRREGVMAGFLGWGEAAQAYCAGPGLRILGENAPGETPAGRRARGPPQRKQECPIRRHGCCVFLVGIRTRPGETPCLGSWINSGIAAKL